MARVKNALRKHEIAPWTDNDTKPAAEAYLSLAKYISSVTDASDEETDDTAFYDSDGTPEETVISIAEAWDVEGHHDEADPAQKMISDMKRLTGDGRRLWHKITYPNGAVVEGHATVKDIVAGGGEASEYQEFSCTLRYNQTPTVTPSV